MELETMYEGLPFSPQTTLTSAIGEADSVIPVADVSVFPDAPNYATIAGNDGDGETILYTAKTGSSLSGCTRGVEGNAKRWDGGEIISRNWTAKDHNSIIKNIKSLESLSEEGPFLPKNRVLVFDSRTVATSAWTSNSSQEGFSYRAEVTGLSGVTTDYVPQVAFAAADAVSGKLAPVAESGPGCVFIYAKELPTKTVTIASIVCLKGGAE